jgi:anti-sigma regulatory factor (Ser/Thr protein kinase)
MLQAVLSINAAPHAAVEARRFVAARLEAWDLTDECPPILLGVSELVTNALVHGAGRIIVRVALAGAVVRVEVCDEGSGTAELRPIVTDGGRVGGWGLRIVDNVADAWGH